MPLPPRVFLTLSEAAARWLCFPSDIVAWSTVGKVALSAAIFPVTAGVEPVCGLVEVAGADVLPLFRRDGASATSIRLRRVRPTGRADWLAISAPAEGVTIEAGDIVILFDEVLRFDEANDMLRRSSVGSGRKTTYVWDDFFLQVIKRIYDQGLPESQNAFVDEMLAWFMRRSETGDAPDESTIRRKIVPIWRELRGE